MPILRLDADHELLIVGCTHALATTFGEDEPATTDAWSAEDGTVADVVIDLDRPAITPVAKQRTGERVTTTDEHTFEYQVLYRSYRDGGTKYLATCACGWRGTPTEWGDDIAQYNEHIGVKVS